MADSGRLLVRCPDRPGIVAAVSQFLYGLGVNIVHSDQHSTHDDPAMFFLRVEFEGIDPDSLTELFRPLAERFNMTYHFYNQARKKRLALFVSKEDHCLQELLWQIQAGDIPAEIAMVVSNHPDLEAVTAPFGIPYHRVSVTKENKEAAEAKQLELVKGVDAVILARYMQILSRRFLEVWHERVINIHHSFLPAFTGARPYHQAYQRGVKLIGATAHYVTAELDAGPIIEQAVVRVDHRHDVAELRRIGRQCERAALAKAVKWHCEDRVLVHGTRTVVFN